MKRTFIYLLMIAVQLFLSACGKEEVKDSSENPGNGEEADSSFLLGMWANIDDSQLTDTYINFDGKIYSKYKAEQKCFIHEKSLWGTNSSNFNLNEKVSYSISDNILYLDGERLGKVSKVKDTLLINGVKYLKMSKISSENHSAIKLKEEDPITYEYNSGIKSVEYEILNPISWASLSVIGNNDWVTDISCVEDNLSFKVSNNDTGEDREGSVSLCYYIDDVAISDIFLVNFKQQYSAAVISFIPEITECDYRGGAFSITYEISNPREGTDVIASSESEWITDIRQDGNMVSFNISENNSGSSRTSHLSLNYGTFTQEYSIYQSYEAPVILVPEPLKCDYSGGDFSLNYDIENPREGVEIVVTSQQDWISGVNPDGNTISFNVLENNSGTSRDGELILSYGSLIKKYCVSQSYAAPIIELSSSIKESDYNGGPFSISYSVINPRKEWKVEFSTISDWIKNVRTSNEEICFEIPEINKCISRQGEIVATYGTMSTVHRVEQIGNLPTAIDLSQSGTANCYIISESNDYKFRTLKGNGSDSVGDVESVEVLWESFGTSVTPSVGDLLLGVAYKDGYIYFSSSNTFQEGNAVVAAKDINGTILWSWHIWLTDVPEDHIYNNNAGTVMDRNLGATSNTPGDIGALGLFYQWGRKDPFIGNCERNSGKKASSTIKWPSPVKISPSNGTISFANAHPTTFICEVDYNDYDWYYSDSGSNEIRWSPEKTIYDPCPPGYRIPEGGINGLWFIAFGLPNSHGSGQVYENTKFDSTNRGQNFGSSASRLHLSDNVSICWYPAAGSLSPSSGDLIHGGSWGCYWACDSDDRSYNFSILQGGNVNATSGQSRATGQSVRCVRE